MREESRYEYKEHLKNRIHSEFRSRVPACVLHQNLDYAQMAQS